jgi:4-hydroxy-tetrahydrodipicolinate reductase
MRIAIVGYGKMGHLVEGAALKRGHEIVATIDPVAPDAQVRLAGGGRAELFAAVKDAAPDGIIEFSHPSAVVENIHALLPLRVPLVVGTTGWKDDEASIKALAGTTGGCLLRSANFSLGVNLFYRVVSEAARLFADEYDVAVWEAHHNQKADSPSGTALEIARRVLAENRRKTRIVTGDSGRRPAADELQVSGTRIGSFPGTHTVFFDSPSDTIELTHTVRNRDGLASGAVFALERFADALASGKLPRGALYGVEDVLDKRVPGGI